MSPNGLPLVGILVHFAREGMLHHFVLDIVDVPSVRLSVHNMDMVLTSGFFLTVTHR